MPVTSPSKEPLKLMALVAVLALPESGPVKLPVIDLFVSVCVPVSVTTFVESRASATVPEARLEAFKPVNAAPLPEKALA